ncbi:hypothetical protein DFJ73DRAFT_812909 [Zopfochytrium polystomum]|nr:hypothetical protein DFJ73DRAFT_812909 [Zopfochytrium polystomum]
MAFFSPMMPIMLPPPPPPPPFFAPPFVPPFVPIPPPLIPNPLIQQQQLRNQRQFVADVRGAAAPWETAPLVAAHKMRLEVSRCSWRVLTLYHQTDKRAARLILASRKFKPGRDGIAGGGIYFADSPQATYRKAHSRGVILRARVNLGNVGVLHKDLNLYKTNYNDVIAQGFDAVVLEGLPSGTEYIVFDPDQIEHVEML